MLALEILLWLGLFSIFYTYLFYPKSLQFLARNKKKQFEFELLPIQNLPRITIVMAAYNEERVIEQKVRSVFNGNYPNELIDFWVGSDCSNDKTNEILTELNKEYPTLKPHLFTERQGKINIINHFLKDAPNDIIISTDANNIFFENTIHELVSALLSDDNIGIVDSNVVHSNTADFNKGIGMQEHYYLNSEVKTKLAEGVLFHTITLFGGCFAMRKKLWKDVPSNFLVDDFLIGLSVVMQGYKSISNPKSQTFEDVNVDPIAEYRRKIRIGTGNFQVFFKHPLVLCNPFTKIGFVMFSHKILRWFGPFVLIFSLIATLILATSHPVYCVLLGIEILSIFISILDLCLRNINIKLPLIRFISHFYTSNICLLIGFFRYIKGVKSSIWSPTQRFQ